MIRDLSGIRGLQLALGVTVGLCSASCVTWSVQGFRQRLSKVAGNLPAPSAPQTSTWRELVCRTSSALQRGDKWESKLQIAIEPKLQTEETFKFKILSSLKNRYEERRVEIYVTDLLWPRQAVSCASVEYPVIGQPISEMDSTSIQPVRFELTTPFTIVMFVAVDDELLTTLINVACGC